MKGLGVIFKCWIAEKRRGFSTSHFNLVSSGKHDLLCTVLLFQRNS